MATKYNFTNHDSKQVRVYLSRDEQTLCYKQMQSSGLKGFFCVERRVPISNLRNFLYGGITTNFKKYVKPMLRNLKRERLDLTKSLSERHITEKGVLKRKV